MGKKIYVLSALTVMCFLAPAASAVNIETVPVANPGNAADTRYATPGYGSVGYTYNIGKYEVTAGQYTMFLNAVAGVDSYNLYNTNMWSSTYGCKIERFAGSGTPGDPYQYRVASDYANRPVNYVSWGDAARFVNWLHNGQSIGAQNADTTETGAYTLNGAMTNAELMTITRNAEWKWAITSEDEWYKAAYHKNDGVTGNYWLYPTSSDNMPYNNLIDPDPGNNATFFDGDDTIGSPYWRTEVGAHENSDSPYGTFDQGGNVWEWNELSVFDLEHGERGLRGGAFNFSGDLVNFLHASVRGDLDPTCEVYDIGFRVSEVPEPGSAILLLIGCMGMISLKRHA